MVPTRLILETDAAFVCAVLDEIAIIRAAIIPYMLDTAPNGAYICDITDKDFHPGVSG
jgi:hypothetical protein